MIFFGEKTRKIGLLVLCLICLALVCVMGVQTAKGTAFADGDVVISDLTSVSAVYGDETVFPVAVGTVNYEKFEYEWYRSETASGLPLKISEGMSEDGNLYLTLNKPSETGYYRAEIISVYENGTKRTVKVQSQTVYMELAAKPVKVTMSDEKLVYNGLWQTPKLTVAAEGVLTGDKVGAYLETGIATINAGTYNARIRLDNEFYTVSEDSEIQFTIEKAPLQIKIKDLAIRSETAYTFEIEYVGLQGEDTTESLGFTPTVSSRFFTYRKPGNYDIYCQGETETVNYVVTYPVGHLYIAKKDLAENEIKGVTATANGVFRTGTILTLTDATAEKVKDLPFLGILKKRYKLAFTSGASEGDNYELSIKGEKISAFMLAVCYLDETGKVHTVDRFSCKDGVLTVVLPSQGVESLVIYNDYTVLLIVGCVLAFILLIMGIAIGYSKQKYRRKRYFYELAKDFADDYRMPQSVKSGEESEDDILY